MPPTPCIRHGRPLGILCAKVPRRTPKIQFGRKPRSDRVAASLGDGETERDDASHGAVMQISDAMPLLPPPQNILRLSFDTHDEFRAYARANARMMNQLWLWHETLGNSDEPFELFGVCDICERDTMFSA